MPPEKRESYFNTISEVANEYSSGYTVLHSVYGSKGRMPEGIGSDKKSEYDKIEIDGGGVLDEDTITAIVMEPEAYGFRAVIFNTLRQSDSEQSDAHCQQCCEG